MLLVALGVVIAAHNESYRMPYPFLGIWSAVFFIGAAARQLPARAHSDPWLPMPLPVQGFLVGMVVGALIATPWPPAPPANPSVAYSGFMALLLLLFIYQDVLRWVFRQLSRNARWQA